MEAMVKKNSEIMWWSPQTNESSGLSKTPRWHVELQYVVINQYRAATRMEAIVKKRSEICGGHLRQKKAADYGKLSGDLLTGLQCVFVDQYTKERLCADSGN